ncbi:MAG TPA: Sec-independent protein translocase protein TatB [Phycisphaerae bacterium]|jgi:sec-independent protein translocase protein TatB|nr:Sec-independent protein translocase protein TatB [Phycisphaerae bacterium]
MFEISFSELVVIAVVALIVVGPERLPAVARTTGRLFARMRRYIIEIKTDIAREIEIDEMQRARSDFEASVRSAEQSAARETDAVRKRLEDIAAATGPSRSAPTAESAKQTPKQA